MSHEKTFWQLLVSVIMFKIIIVQVIMMFRNKIVAVYPNVMFESCTKMFKSLAKVSAWFDTKHFCGSFSSFYFHTKTQRCGGLLFVIFYFTSCEECAAV